MTLTQKIDDARAFLAAQIAAAQAPCITGSFQTECMVMLHLLRPVAPRIPILFIDTGYHFPETIEYRDRMAATWDLNVVTLYPRQTVAQQESQFGILYETAADRCCAMRKVEPLFAALESYDVWFTGLRRDQSPSRANLQHRDVFRLPSGKQLQKISPLADWTSQDVWHYLKIHAIPVLPLYDQGYTSIGCQPCTSLPVIPGDLRSGRWGGQKLECGIHVGR